jgi:hypothetical protein
MWQGQMSRQTCQGYRRIRQNGGNKIAFDRVRFYIRLRVDKNGYKFFHVAAIWLAHKAILSNTMFTTFSASTSENLLGDRVGDCRSLSPASGRPRRHQVSRACGWCRAYRIKCDDKIPCRNCVSKGRQCAEKGADEVRTFALAVKYAYYPSQV